MKKIFLILLLTSQAAFAINISSLLVPELREKKSKNKPDYSITYMDGETEQRIHLSGVIYPQNGMGRIREAMAKLKPGKSVRLYLGAHYGGLHSKNVEVGEAIRKVCEGYGPECKVTTEVGELCYSACIDLFMFGTERVAKPNSFFAFHEAWVIHPKLAIKGYSDKKLIKEGVNPEWLAAHPELKSNQENGYILRADGLQGSNIVTHLRDPKCWWDNIDQSCFVKVP
ncbi:MAG: hypothetical protein V4736_09300 [Bdellovibrionota bacterium]